MDRRAWTGVWLLVVLLAALGLAAPGCGDTPFGTTLDDDDNDDGADDDAGDDDGSDDDAGDDDTQDPCEDIVCGDNAHCEAGQCYCDEGFEGDPWVGCDPIVSEEERIRAKLVEIAMAEEGMCEGVDDRPYMQYQPGYWCYDFVAWVYEEADEGLPYPLALPQVPVPVPKGWRPAPGDLIKYQIQHYGMVASLSGDQLTVLTIEGNVNYCVMQRQTTDSSVEYYGTLEDWMANLE